MNIPPQYQSALIADFPEHVETIEAWLEDDLPGLMTFTGPCGTGKTRMLYAIALRCRESMRWDVPTLIVKVQRGAMMVMDAFNQNRTRIIDRLIDHNHQVLLDDLGAEKTTDFILQELYRLISQRELWGKPTLITTNLSLDDLKTKLDDRIASRLAGGIVLRFEGNDYRVAKKEIAVPAEHDPNAEMEDDEIKF